MGRSTITITLALLLMALGLGFSYYKWSHYQFPLTPMDQFKSWYVELSVSMNSTGRGTPEAFELSVLKPRDRSNLAVASPQLLAHGYGLNETRSTYKLSKRRPDRKESFLLRFSLYELDINEGKNDSNRKPVRGRYHPSNRLSNADDSTMLFYEEIDRLSDLAQAKSSSSLSFTRQMIHLLSEDASTRKLLKEMMGEPDDVGVLEEMLEANAIRARAVNGFRLSDASRSVSLLRWIEVWYKDKWHRFFLTEQPEEDTTYYAWWYGDAPVVIAPEGYQVRTQLALKANNDGAFTRSLWLSEQQDSLAYHVALQTLPLKQQLVLQVLLLLPMGALIVTIFRQIIGVQTFGTFMPVLVALALRETGLVYGIIFFFGIIMVGLIARLNMGKLQLLMVPRLSAVLCVVVLAIVCFMLLNKDQSIPLGISVALFPVIIIVMFIERMTTMMDESGMKSALIGCVGSLFVACLIYLLIMQPLVQHLIFTFPEFIIVIMALCMMIGRYNGFKVTEYRRFWQLQRQIKKRRQQEEHV